MATDDILPRLKGLFKDSRVRYVTVGGSSVVLEYGSFWILVTLGAHFLAGNIISFLLGFIFTFIMHNRWSFAGHHKYKVKVQFVSYGALAVINIIATTLLMSVQVDVLYIPALAAKFICMALVAVWNYLLLNRIIFKRHSSSS